MTEPNGGDGRVPDVHAERAASLNVPGEPVLGVPDAVFDLESRLEVEVVADEYRAEFHSFYVVHRDRIGRALALTLRDQDLASDAVDEAMVRAYQRWARVRTLDNPGGWAYRVGLNHARSRLRRVGRWLTHAPRVAGTDSHADGIPGDPAIVAALAGLSIDHRSVVICRLLLDWSEADTAAALDIRPGTVKSRLARALAQLQPRLAHLQMEES